jgi:hypothetical protein
LATEIPAYCGTVETTSLVRLQSERYCSELFPFAAIALDLVLYPPSYKALTLPFMSHVNSTVSSTSNYQFIINNALEIYKSRTKNDLLEHPLAAQLQSCDSPGAILFVLQQQIKELDQSRSSDERWSRWLDPTVSVLYALSSALGAGVGLVCHRT